MGPPPDIFISYNHGSKPDVKRLLGRLQEHDFKCWMDIARMKGGEQLSTKIEKNLSACKVVIACITDKYTESPACRFGRYILRLID